VVVLLLVADVLLRAVPGYADLVGGRILPTIGSQTPDLGGTFWQRQLDVLAHLFLPTLTLVLVAAAPYTRYVRAGMLEALGQDFVRTARAKGVAWPAIVVRHALRTALVPITTLAALDAGIIIGGAVVTETVFGWQGMGTLFITGLLQADPAPVMAFYLVTGASVAVCNLLADIACAALDPRVRPA
jgi:peptide/nickel transport system permease protein